MRLAAMLLAGALALGYPAGAAVHAQNTRVRAIETGIENLLRNTEKYLGWYVSTVGYVGSSGRRVGGRYYHMYPYKVGEFHFGLDGLIVLEDPAVSNMKELMKRSGSRKFRIRGEIKADKEGGISYFLNLHKAEVLPEIRTGNAPAARK